MSDASSNRNTDTVVQSILDETESNMEQISTDLSELQQIIEELIQRINDKDYDIKNAASNASSFYFVCKKHWFIFFLTYGLVVVYFASMIITDNRQINVDKELELRRQNMEHCAKLYDNNRFTRYCIQLSKTNGADYASGEIGR